MTLSGLSSDWNNAVKQFRSDFNEIEMVAAFFFLFVSVIVKNDVRFAATKC